MQQPDASMQARILEFENPTFGYRRGEDGGIEKDVFEGEPLPEGWADSPAKVDDRPGRTRPVAPFTDGLTEGLPPGVKRDPWVPPSEPLEASLSLPYEDHKFNDLKSEYKRRTGKGPTAGTNKETVVRMLQKLDIDWQ